MYSLEKEQPIVLSLQEVSANFEQWRSTRSKKGKIPETLWEQALPLLPKHSVWDLTKTLGISKSQIDAKLKSPPVNNNVPVDAAQSCDFVAINIPQTIEEINTQPTGKIEIKRPDGAAISIEHVNQKTLTHILTQFMQGL